MASQLRIAPWVVSAACVLAFSPSVTRGGDAPILVEALEQAPTTDGASGSFALRLAAGGTPSGRTWVEFWSYHPREDVPGPSPGGACDSHFRRDARVELKSVRDLSSGARVGFVDYWAIPRLRVRSSGGERFWLIAPDGGIVEDPEREIPPRPVVRDLELRIDGKDLRFRSKKFSPEWRTVARLSDSPEKSFEPLTAAEEKRDCAKSIFAARGRRTLEDWQLESFVQELFPHPDGLVAYPWLVHGGGSNVPWSAERETLPADHHRFYCLLEWPKDGRFVIHFLDVQGEKGPALVGSVSKDEFEEAVRRGARSRGTRVARVQFDPPAQLEGQVTAMTFANVTVRDPSGIGQESFLLPFCTSSREQFLRSLEQPDFRASYNPCH